MVLVGFYTVIFYEGTLERLRLMMSNLVFSFCHSLPRQLLHSLELRKKNIGIADVRVVSFCRPSKPTACSITVHTVS